MRAIVFHKHVEQGDARYGSSRNKHYLHGAILKKQRIGYTSIIVLVEGDDFNRAKIGDTLLLKYNKLLDLATLEDIIPVAQQTTEIEDKEIYVK